MLDHMSHVFDRHFFYDDQSTDDTLEIARLYCTDFARRYSDVPSFAENEGRFRGAAWNAFESQVRPEIGDWVLVIDCDEVMVTLDSAHPSDVLDEMLMAAENPSGCVTINIPEVFAFNKSDGRPLIRTDRLWGTIHAPRFFAYKPGGSYPSHGFGVPAVPSYVMSLLRGSAPNLSLMHYGYAEADDQVHKYLRYTGEHGHSNAHVESICASDKVLQYWVTPYVKEMRAQWTLLTS